MKIKKNINSPKKMPDAELKNKREALFIWILILLIPLALVAEKVKVYQIPSDVKVDTKGLKETVIRNLSEEEIFVKCPMVIFNDHIYATRLESCDVVKLTLNGVTVAQFGRKGAGPREFSGGFGNIVLYKDQIVVSDYNLCKLVYLDKNLKCIKEAKYNHRAFAFTIMEDEIYFYGQLSKPFYFDVYDKNYKKKRSIFPTMTPVKLLKKLLNFDKIRTTLYLPQEKGIWCGFGNRYDLRYYKNEKLAIEIKEQKDFFKGTEEVMMDKKFYFYTDRAVHLSIEKNSLIYFFFKDDASWCDVFDLANLKLNKRIHSNQKYIWIAHFRGNVFYSMRYDADKENVYLVKLEVL